MYKSIRKKIMNSFLSIFPISFIVTILSLVWIPIPTDNLIAFLIGVFLRFLGLIFFTLGIEIGMMKIGEEVGTYITKKQKLWIIILFGFFIGLFVTLAEPDLKVLASQVPSIPPTLLILVIGVGVGLFLVMGLLRIVFQIPIRLVLLIGYGLVFLVAGLIPAEFIPLAFDSGGVTTGSMTVPFVMALGFGVAYIHSSSSSQDDSFGLIGIASIGPILAVLCLGLFYGSNLEASAVGAPILNAGATILERYGIVTLGFMLEVLISISPIILLFICMQFFAFKLTKRKVLRIFIGVGLAYIGLVFLLSGAYVGFLPIGNQVGADLASGGAPWILIPIGMLFGFAIIISEPAVHVLNKQVEEITSGTISKRLMMIGFSISASLSVGLAMVRILWNLPIFLFLLPFYAIALLLTFVVPKTFTAIAFDSGGVASGPMTATFLLPFALGASSQMPGSNPFLDGFGLVAFVAMTPLVVIQLMGLIYAWKTRAIVEKEEVDEILEL